jgi:secondary thiamine-phosphate synthase enzyme
MKQASCLLTIATRGKGLTDITRQVAEWLEAAAIETGLVTLWCRQTSASLTVQENADPTVRADILRFFAALVPEDASRYAHADEGLDDMPAHLRSMLTTTQLSVPVAEGRMVLGTWQALYVFENRNRPHDREIALHVIGE